MENILNNGFVIYIIFKKKVIICYKNSLYLLNKSIFRNFIWNIKKNS